MTALRRKSFAGGDVGLGVHRHLAGGAAVTPAASNPGNTITARPNRAGPSTGLGVNAKSARPGSRNGAAVSDRDAAANAPRAGAAAIAAGTVARAADPAGALER